MVFEPKAKSIFKYDTIWPADTVEFCPHPDAYNVLVCGTYKLQEEQSAPPTSEDDIERTSVKPAKQTRHGELLLWSLNSAGGSEDGDINGDVQIGEIASRVEEDKTSGYETGDSENPEDEYAPDVQDAKPYYL